MQKNVEKYLEKRAKDLAEEWKDNIEERFGKKLTPIEMLFFIEWAYRMDEENNVPPAWERFYIYPQYDITLKNSKRYRVDFFIKYTKDWKKFNKKESVIVELDSYLWHGSTPEQFTKEKKRERDLVSEGYEIIRFSGREVYRNPEKCVNEVMNYMEEKMG